MVVIVLLCLVAWIPTPPSLALVRLKSISVPPLVQNGSVDHIVLDCPYQLSSRGEAEGLVLKWYLNSRTIPIYQWIPPSHPQGLGTMRERIDLDFEVTRDPYTRHRALFLIRPTIDMSGVYTCKVSTLDNEVSKSSRMIVYSPPSLRDVRMVARDLPSEHAVNISCIVDHSYPRPRLALYHGQGRNRMRLKGVREGDMVYPNGAFRVTQYIVLDHASLALQNVFECELALPGTDYRYTKPTIYSPGLPAVLARANSACGSTLCTLLVLLPTLLLSTSSPSISFSTFSTSVLSLPIPFLKSLPSCTLLILCLSCKVFWNSFLTLLHSINSLSHTQIHIKSLLTLPTPSDALLKSSKTITPPQILPTLPSTTQDNLLPIQS